MTEQIRVTGFEELERDAESLLRRIRNLEQFMLRTIMKQEYGERGDGYGA